ncbi:MAG: sterol desaturase family protein [Myxococcota bacterium]
MDPIVTTRWVLLVGFFTLLVVELSLARRERQSDPQYAWKDSLESWCLLSLTGAISGVSKLFLFAVYGVVLERFALREWGGTALEYALAFLAYDLVAYGFHRASHRVGFLWAIHAVHHQSEQFNLTVAMRTAPLRNLFDWPTLLPLALLGVPAGWVGLLFLVHIAGQYWIHTTWIPNLGPVGWILNTPSHHRVHHGVQPRYRDANYGANLIVFDRLFGTFVPEGEPAEFGVTDPVGGWSPLRSTFRPFADLWERSRTWPLADRLQVWIRPPGWAPPGIEPVQRPFVPKADFSLVSLPDAVITTALVSLLLLCVPSAAGVPAVAVGLFGFGMVALARVGASLEGTAVRPVWDGLFAMGLGLAAAVAPSHGGVFAVAGAGLAIWAGARWVQALSAGGLASRVGM